MSLLVGSTVSRHLPPTFMAHALFGFGVHTNTGGSLVGRVSLFHFSYALLVSWIFLPSVAPFLMVPVR